jgi:NADH:ubiquinone oxidoreductase subunit E
MVTIYVCIGSACHLKGSYNVITELQRKLTELKINDKVEIAGSFCLGHCTKAVSVKVDKGEVLSLSAENVSDFLQNEILNKL